MNCSCQDNQCLNNNTKEFELLKELISKYKGEAGSLIPVLQKAQEIYGYLSAELLGYIAREMNIKKAKIYGVATFYTQFRLKPVGKHLILICQGTACHVNGSDRIEAALLDELKIELGETTADKMFTLDSAACLGCCSLAPVMMINGQAYGPLTSDSARKIVNDIRKKEGAKEGEAI